MEYDEPDTNSSARYNEGVAPIPWREVTLGYNSLGKGQQQYATMKRNLMMYKSKHIE